MKYKWMKKEQRKVNSFVKKVNRTLYNDPLWRNRFGVRQNRVVNVQFYESYMGNSGGIFTIEFILFDRKTGLEKKVYVENYRCGWRLFVEMNDFIIHDAKVWEENPRPSIDSLENFRNKI